MGNAYQREVPNFSNNLVTSPLIFNIFFTAQRERNFIYLLCLYLNWLNIFFVSCVQKRVYQLRVHDGTELKQRLLDVWHGMEQGVNSAIDEWRRRIRACVRAKGEHFEQKMWKCQ